MLSWVISLIFTGTQEVAFLKEDRHLNDKKEDRQICSSHVKDSLVLISLLSFKTKLYVKAKDTLQKEKEGNLKQLKALRP